MHPRVLAGFLLYGPLLIAQAVTGSGYAAPTPVSVAPGEVATFYVAGLTSLTGITATLQQESGNTPAPVLSIQSAPLCPTPTAVTMSSCGSLTAVTVQIPYELVTVCTLCEPPPPVDAATLRISQNGQPAGAIQLNALADEVHVLTACDVALGPPTPPPPNYTGLPCAPMVTHAGGSLVTFSSPASVGETLTVWASGLGQTIPPATTGKPSITAPAAETFYLNFNYQVNALPTKPIPAVPAQGGLVPLFAGLAPGYIGLYQVNFTVPPQPPNGTPQCTSLPGLQANPADIWQSNFTVSIGGQYSFDGAGICVATQIPVD